MVASISWNWTVSGLLRSGEVCVVSMLLLEEVGRQETRGSEAETFILKCTSPRSHDLRQGLLVGMAVLLTACCTVSALGSTCRALFLDWQVGPCSQSPELQTSSIIKRGFATGYLESWELRGLRWWFQTCWDTWENRAGHLWKFRAAPSSAGLVRHCVYVLCPYFCLFGSNQILLGGYLGSS